MAMLDQYGRRPGKAILREVFRRSLSCCLAMVAIWAAAAATVRAVEPVSVAADSPEIAVPSPKVIEQFEKKVRPLLLARCGKCHGAEKTKGGLRLDSAAGLAAGGDSGPAVVQGKPDDSRLIQAVRQTG